MKTSTRTAAIGASLFLMSLSARAFSEAREPNEDKIRVFDFTYEVTLKDLPSDAGSVKLWIPVASSDAGQTVTVENVSGPVKLIESRDPEYGNRIFYANLSPSGSSTAHFTVMYRVTRRPYSGQQESAAGASEGNPSIARFLHADKLVP